MSASNTVTESAVDATGGSQTTALHEGLTGTEEELQDLVRSRLADYKVPERIVLLPMLPEGPTGKVDRLALKEMTLASVVEKGKSQGSLYEVFGRHAEEQRQRRLGLGEMP
jgi:acyl-coenzyme A synthetase/AMP-(fatty) acid ligase